VAIKDNQANFDYFFQLDFFSEGIKKKMFWVKIGIIYITFKELNVLTIATL
jgi:hypothetical protein